MDIYTKITKSDNQTDRQPIVLVHGSWGSSQMWDRYSDFLQDHEWNVYAVDLRGHGQSGGEVAGATMDDYVDDVRAAVKQNDLENPIIIGHSMGGLVTLMYARDYDPHAVVAIDPSPSVEVQGSKDKSYKDEYTPFDAGMPKDPKGAVKALPDITPEIMKKMKSMLGVESGVARSQRKKGVSIPKETLDMPTLFVGGEHGESEKIDFGIGIETAEAMANHYDKPVIEIVGASHPGILIGKNAEDAVARINDWLVNNAVS